jgi:hypothetical protein
MEKWLWFTPEAIQRVGDEIVGAGLEPKIIGDDLDAVADQLIARRKEQE